MTSASRAQLILLLKNSKINEQREVTQTENAEMSESDASEHNEGWQSPSERRRIKKPKTTTESQNRLELKNTYDPLQNVEENEKMDTPPSQEKEKLPSPIIVHGHSKDHDKLTTSLKNSIGNQYLYYQIHQIQHQHIHQK
jgi:hypothetical protein